MMKMNSSVSLEQRRFLSCLRITLAGLFVAVEGHAAENDGEFVLFGQGRHVLESNSYRQVVVSKLDNDMVRLGPVTILYIKEGFIGGAFERNSGHFRILNPGPPYILHEKDYEGIELKKRTLAPFNVGPIHFMTVK